jgi:Family of unknown function (DUF5677)
MEFEFGETDQGKKFFRRHPDFYGSFERLMELANRCFGRAIHPKSRVEDICFDLGHTCRADYLEILFLAANCYGTAALKLLRGLYERSVALAYIVKHPEKAERFVRYAAIQEKKALDRALEVVTEVQFDEAIWETTAAEIRERYEAAKAEFQVTVCNKCKHKGTAFSWDIDTAAMVRDVGEPYSKYFVGCYTIPTLHIHATLASVAHEPDTDKRRDRSHREADFALLNATLMLILSIRLQNDIFALQLDEQIQACENDVLKTFVSR